MHYFRFRDSEVDVFVLLTFFDFFPQQGTVHSERNQIANMRVKIKWNKQVFEDVEIDPSLGVEVFKSQIFSLTGKLRCNRICT